MMEKLMKMLVGILLALAGWSLSRNVSSSKRKTRNQGL